MTSGITNATRREVYERDGLRCTYVAEDGRRCEARAFLELDHAVAKALGGPGDARNLRVRCRAHNQLAAEQTFGRELINSIKHLRQEKSTDQCAPAAPLNRTAFEPTAQELAQRKESAATLEKVRQALRRMGFRDTQARAAIATVIRMHAPDESLALEKALREAVLVATAA